MSNDVINTLILSAVLVLALGAGFYVTQKAQPAKLDALVAEEEAIRMRAAEVEDLLAQEAIASEEAAEAFRRWNARYKILPDQLSSPDVVEYLNALSRSGFRAFDITLAGVERHPNYSIYSYNVTGLAYFESLYGFIWNVENGRGLYRLRDVSIRRQLSDLPNPETGVARQVVLAQFSLAIDAYFAGSEGMSGVDSVMTVPANVLPPRRPALNPFYPLVLEALPPNTDDLVDVEADALVSVIGNQAVFSRGGQLRTLRPGDAVYLGRVTAVDPNVGRVVIDLNKGGIRERVELDLQSGERYRQALGSVQLEAFSGPVMETPPPAPGTPEARRAGLYQDAPIPQGAPAGGQ
jgi:hypothetical protein